jgi:hypothetical protein
MSQDASHSFIYDSYKQGIHTDGSEGNLRNSRNILYLQQDSTFDLLQDQEKGKLAISTSAIDPMRKAFYTSEYKYDSDFDKSKHVSDTPGSTLNSNAVELFAENPTTSKYLVTNWKLSESDYVKKKDAPTANKVRLRQDFASIERSVMAQLHSVRTTIAVPGNPYIKVGDTIHIVLPALGLNRDEDDKFISGKYLITALSHKCNAASADYNTVIEIMKDSYEAEA